MHANRKQQKKEKSALNISLYGGLIFVFLEFFMSIYTHSQAVLLDAIYDGVELVMILLSIGLVPFLYKPSNEKHPYGYLQVESLFVVIKGFMMISVTIGLIVNNMEIALKGGRNISFSSIAVFELFATILSIFIISSLRKRNRKINSPLVRMEIQEWTIDVIASLGMSFAFFLPTLIHGSWFVALTPYLDQIVAIILSLFMLPTPIKSVITGLRDLFLLAPEEETLDSIKSLITPLLREYGYTDLYFDIVRTGRKLWISVYITFDKDLVSISTFTTLQNKIIASLQTEYQDFYFELLPDIKYTKSTS